MRNPLLGPRGATRTFGPQKGATPEQLDILERALTRVADVAAEHGRDFRDTPGAGAAGGLGFGLLTFCGAMLRPGFDVVAETAGLRALIAAADYVITGEGNLDRQTLEGKVPAGVARIARELGKPIFAIVGGCSDDAEVRALFDGIYPLDDRSPRFARTAELLEQRARARCELARLTNVQQVERELPLAGSVASPDVEVAAARAVVFAPDVAEIAGSRDAAVRRAVERGLWCGVRRSERLQLRRRHLLESCRRTGDQGAIARDQRRRVRRKFTAFRQL